MAHKLPAEQVPPPTVLLKKTTALVSLERQGTGTTARGSCRLCIAIIQALLSSLGALGQALALLLLMALLQAAGLDMLFYQSMAERILIPSKAIHVTLNRKCYLWDNKFYLWSGIACGRQSSYAQFAWDNVHPPSHLLLELGLSCAAGTGMLVSKEASKETSL